MASRRAAAMPSGDCANIPLILKALFIFNHPDSNFHLLNESSDD
jgi:hypothetical protein